MSSFIQTFLKEIGTGDQVRDWQHASKLFVGDNFRLSPKLGFLFHVAFDINQVAIAGSQAPTTPDSIKKVELGMMVKSAELPKFNIDTKVLNSYNRPNIVQNKINFEPLSITFHDDSADTVRNFWYDYYSYYYRTSDYNQEVYNQTHKYKERQSTEWGYSIKGDNSAIFETYEPYLRAIRIYSLHQKRFSEYTLVNPIIRTFAHGSHSYDDNGPMSHTMTIEYESVLYADGNVSPNSVHGFADIHYDRGPSPLTPAGGGTNSILGPGGIVNAVDDVVRNLNEGNIGAAVFTGFRAFQKNKGLDLKQLAVSEAISIGKDILRGNNPLAKIQVPSLNGVAGALNSVFGVLPPASPITASASTPTPPVDDVYSGDWNVQYTVTKVVSNTESVGSSPLAAPSNYNPPLKPTVATIPPPQTGSGIIS